jgi:hypothetical protein
MSQGLLALVPAGIENLLETVVVLLFFAVPILRSILSGKNKKKEDERKPRPRPQPARRREPEGDSGLEMWERLLRGEIELEERPAAPPPLPPPPRPAHKRTPKRAPAQAPPLESAPAGPLVASVPLPSGKPLVGELGPQMSTVSEDEIEARGEDVSPPQPLAALATGLAAEDLALSQITSEAALEGAPSATPADTLGLEHDWRRAVVLSEVLGTPLALRRDRSDALPAFQ